MSEPERSEGSDRERGRQARGSTERSETERTDQLRRLALAWNEAWNSRDVSRLTRFFAPRSTFYEPSLAAPLPGVEGITASAEKTWADWPRAVFDPVSITVDPPRVVIEWRTSAAHRSGLQHLLEGVDILEVDGDLVTACRVYYDTRLQPPPVKRAGGGKRRAAPSPRARGSKPPRPRR